MTINFLGVSMCCLVAAGLIVIARWFHPATFSADLTSAAIIAMLLTAVVHIWHRNVT